MDALPSAVISGFPHLRVTGVEVHSDGIHVEAVAETAAVTCPLCGRWSDRVHSRYRRRVRDLPWQGRSVVLRLAVRKFHCGNPRCPRAIFCERIPDFITAHARTTNRQTDAHRVVGFALGGEAGARAAKKLAMPTSPDTLLRRVKQSPEPECWQARFVGVDDWAWRKAKCYGTILVDLERHRVIDILSGRDGSALGAWLKERPEIEMISRDRCPAYAHAAREGAPQAQQVADRWHLLKNLRETVERLLSRTITQVRDVLRDETPNSTSEATSSSERMPIPWPREQYSARQQQREEKHRMVHELRAQRLTFREIAAKTELAPSTVRQYLLQQRCPDWYPGKLTALLEGYHELIEQWLTSGKRNRRELYRMLQSKGYRASYDTVKVYIRRRIGKRQWWTTSRVVAPRPVPSARKLSFEFIRRESLKKLEERARMKRLQSNALWREPLRLAAAFIAMVRREKKGSLGSWLARAKKSTAVELRKFAAAIEQDKSAVAAALTERWNNGQVEGQVNRLKLLKRQMYGRAGFQLLRKRVRHAA